MVNEMPDGEDVRWMEEVVEGSTVYYGLVESAGGGGGGGERTTGPTTKERLLAIHNRQIR